METKKKIIIVILLIFIIVLIVVGVYLVIKLTPISAPASEQKTSPCSSYVDTSVNVSDACIDKLWIDGGCPQPGIDQKNYYKANRATMTKLQIANDAKAWATLPDVDHRTACYGSDRTKWPAAPTPAPMSAALMPAPMSAAPMPAPMSAAPMPAPMPAPAFVVQPGSSSSETVTGRSVSTSSPIKFVHIGRIENSPGGLSININEIKAYDASNNLIPFTISMYGPDGDEADGLAGFPASNASDGNLNNFAHTNESMKSFIKVGFASETPIAKLVVYPRPGFKNRMIGTKVEFFNGNGQEAAPSISINAEQDQYTFEFRTTGNSSSWLASRINTPQYLRHLQNKNYLLY